MNKLMFISGPYSAPTKLEVESNINKAREVAVWCAEHGIYYFCPHLNSAHFELWAPDVPVEFYYEMDFRISETCDAIIMLPNWQQSKGATGEHRFFKVLSEPIFYWPNEQDMILHWHKENR